MKCPLFVMGIVGRKGHTEGPETMCLKEECAWWRDDIQMCAIKDLSLELGYTQHILADILSIMLHEEHAQISNLYKLGLREVKDDKRRV